jgi:NADPH:quinone reductase-like Zn-dependent oxidoreductase
LPQQWQHQRAGRGDPRDLDCRGYAVQLAKHFAATVTGVCSAANIDLVRFLGADRVMDYTTQDFTRTGDEYVAGSDG